MVNVKFGLRLCLSRPSHLQVTVPFMPKPSWHFLVPYLAPPPPPSMLLCAGLGRNVQTRQPCHRVNIPVREELIDSKGAKDQPASLTALPKCPTLTFKWENETGACSFWIPPQLTFNLCSLLLCFFFFYSLLLIQRLFGPWAEGRAS